MTDAADKKLKQAAHEFAYYVSAAGARAHAYFAQDPGYPAEWAKLLEAVDEYALWSTALRDPSTRDRVSRRLDVLEAVDDGAITIVRVASGDYQEQRIALLEAKARVYDAIAAWEPEENRNSTSWARVSEELRAVRELEKTR